MNNKKRQVYAARFVVQCPSCKTHAHLPFEISTEMLPLVLICAKCQEVWTWEKEFPILPKMQPINLLEHWHVMSQVAYNQSQQGFQTAQEEVTQAPELSEEELPVPFFELATQIGIQTKDLFSNIAHLKGEIKNFETQVGTYFKQEWKRASEFKKFWRPDYLAKFIQHPFICLPIKCEQELMSAYARWIICPKFYEPNFGIPVNVAGGLRLYLLNAYTRIEFPVETKMAEEFDLPPSLDLKVRGNKITGGSLPHCWQDIPGLLEDHDSTEEWASVYIHKSEPARRWLAQHGVMPWDTREVKTNELMALEAIDQIYENERFLRAWKKFVRTGRLGIYWNNVLESRRFASFAGTMIKGVTAVFTSTDKDCISWKSFTQMGSKITTRDFVFFKNGDPIHWEPVMRCRLIILDIRGGIDLEVIRKLYQYNGRLIVLGYDSIMDFDTANVQASMIYSLTGYSDFEEVKMASSAINIGGMSDFPALFESLSRLTGRQAAEAEEQEAPAGLFPAATQ